MTLKRAKRDLFLLWMSGGILLFIVLIAQSYGGHYEPKTREAWGWLLPLILPTLALIIGVVVADAQTGKNQDADEAAANVGPMVYWLGFGLSLFYLLLVALAILVQPMSQSSPMEVLQLSNLWLGPLQGLTAGVLAVFFRSSKPKAA